MGDVFVQSDASNLLLNKFVVVIGDSVQRGVYKDLVVFLQSNAYLTINQMKQKGEYSHCNDKLLEGGQFGEMKNDVSFREVRQYQTDFHLVRFYFATRVYSEYMEKILAELSEEPRPDVIIINCCLWDITDSLQKSVDSYRENLKVLMRRFNEVLPEDCLVIWCTVPPVKGGVKMGKTAQSKSGSSVKEKRLNQVYPELEFLQDKRRLEVMAANMFARQIVVEHGYDVLDIHYYFRREIHRRIFDGIHWDMTGHRRLSNLLLTHIAEAWGKSLPNRIRHNPVNTMNRSALSPPEPKPAITDRKIGKAKRRMTQVNSRNNCFTDMFSGESADMHGYFRFDDDYQEQQIPMNNSGMFNPFSPRHQGNLHNRQWGIGEELAHTLIRNLVPGGIGDPVLNNRGPRGPHMNNRLRFF